VPRKSFPGVTLSGAATNDTVAVVPGNRTRCKSFHHKDCMRMDCIARATDTHTYGRSTHLESIVPTPSVGTHAADALRPETQPSPGGTTPEAARAAERPYVRSHAERGNEKDGQPRPNSPTDSVPPRLQ